jgi:hypothetical protein
MQVTTLGMSAAELLSESNTPKEGDRDGRESEHGGEGGNEGEGGNDGSKEEKEAEESSGQRP